MQWGDEAFLFEPILTLVYMIFSIWTQPLSSLQYIDVVRGPLASFWISSSACNLASLDSWDWMGLLFHGHKETTLFVDVLTKWNKGTLLGLLQLCHLSGQSLTNLWVWTAQLAPSYQTAQQLTTKQYKTKLILLNRSMHHSRLISTLMSDVQKVTSCIESQPPTQWNQRCLLRSVCRTLHQCLTKQYKLRFMLP